MKNVGLLLRELREEAGLSIREVAEALGIPHSTYARREKETKRPFLPREWAEPIANVFEKHGVGRSRVMYLAGEGNMQADSRALPVVAWVAAGKKATTNNIPEDQRSHVLWPFPQKMPDNVAAIEVRGSDMDQKYPAGSTVFVVPSASISEAGKSVEPGDLVVVRERHADGAFKYTLKELQQGQDGAFLLAPRSKDLTLQSVHYEPVQEWYIGRRPGQTTEDSLYIAGAVVGGLINYMGAGQE